MIAASDCCNSMLVTVKVTTVMTANAMFVSSRSRHPSCLSDWSSDVCSSDLPAPRWSHCTTVKCASHGATVANDQGFVDRKSVVKGKSADLGDRGVAVVAI